MFEVMAGWVKENSLLACLLACLLLALDNVIVVTRRTLFFSLIPFFIAFIPFPTRRKKIFLFLENKRDLEILNIFDNFIITLKRSKCRLCNLTEIGLKISTVIPFNN